MRENRTFVEALTAAFGNCLQHMLRSAVDKANKPMNVCIYYSYSTSLITPGQQSMPFSLSQSAFELLATIPSLHSYVGSGSSSSAPSMAVITLDGEWAYAMAMGLLKKLVPCKFFNASVALWSSEKTMWAWPRMWAFFGLVAMEMMSP